MDMLRTIADRVLHPSHMWEDCRPKPTVGPTTIKPEYQPTVGRSTNRAVDGDFGYGYDDVKTGPNNDRNGGHAPAPKPHEVRNYFAK